MIRGWDYSVLKRRRNKETNRGDEHEYKRTKNEDRRDEERFGKDIRTSTGSDNLYEEECAELLKELLELSSKESSLIFELSQLLENYFHPRLILNRCMKFTSYQMLMS